MIENRVQRQTNIVIYYIILLNFYCISIIYNHKISQAKAEHWKCTKVYWIIFLKLKIFAQMLKKKTEDVIRQLRTFLWNTMNIQNTVEQLVPMEMCLRQKKEYKLPLGCQIHPRKSQQTSQPHSSQDNKPWLQAGSGPECFDTWCLHQYSVKKLQIINLFICYTTLKIVAGK